MEERLYKTFNYSTNMISISFTEKFNTKYVTNLEEIFYNCISLLSVDLSKLITVNLKSTRGMFYNCQKLTFINFTNFNTSLITTMSSMFAGCSSLSSIDLSSFKTKNLENIEYMFSNCRELISLNLSNFNISKVNNMNNMLFNCYSLIYLDISSFQNDILKNISIYHGINSLSGTIKVRKKFWDLIKSEFENWQFIIVDLDMLLNENGTSILFNEIYK